MPEMTPARMGLGCVNLLTLITGGVAGFYRGMSEAKGIPVADMQINSFLVYGTPVLSGLLTFMFGSDIVRDPSAFAEINRTVNAPPEVEGCQKGCAPIFGGILGAGVMGGINYGAYCLGSYLGKH